MSSARTEVSIVGVGLHPFGRHDPALTGMAMGAHASRLALADAGVSWADIGYAVGGSNVSGKPDTLVGVLGLTGAPPAASRSPRQQTRSGPARPTSRSSSGSTSTPAAPSRPAQRTTATRTG